ncbi:MAG TPA: CPBP family intramembrane glutamic endopeptidase [Planctomycetota bacterium]|nr:CPBP family intramembrane glutamic endopeptidase [Planctomycetota bacterium]
MPNLLAGYSPALAALVILMLRPGSSGPRFRGLGARSAPWFAAAWLLPFALALATLGLGLLSPRASFSPTIEQATWTWVPPDDTFKKEWEVWTPEGMGTARVAEGVHLEKLLRTGPPTSERMEGNWEARPVVTTIRVSVRNQVGKALWVGPTVATLLALGEEVGWRGFLLGELLPLGVWRSSLLVGVVWGLWHAPGILLGSRVFVLADPIADLLAQVAFTILLSPIFSWIRVRSGSVLAAAILHGGVNAAGWLPLLFEPRDAMNGTTIAIAGTVVLLAAWGAIARFDRSFLRAVAGAAPEASPGTPERAP